jgi:hypothetical protein
LLNHRGKPGDNSDLAHILRVDEEVIEFAIQVLTDKEVAWIEVAESAKFPESLESQENRSAFLNETKRNETEVKLTQRNERAPGESGQDNKQQGAGNKGDNGQVFDDSKSSSSSTRFDHSTRLDFSNKLRKILCPANGSDLTALWNIQQWADRLANAADVYERLLEIAKDSQNGRNPMAVFFSRVDKELGYRARVEADNRK